MELTSQRTLKIVSVDPGNNLGMACLEVDLDTKQIVVVDAHTLIIDDVIKFYHPELLETHGTLLARTFVINKYLNKYCESHAPDYGLHETAFSSHGRKQFGNAVESFAKLRENILAIKLAMMHYDNSMPIIPINPQTVKYAVVGVQSSDKSMVSAAILAKDDLTITIDHQYLDEHGWDAIAIGYTFIKKQIFGVPKNEHSKRNQRTKRNKAKRARRRVSNSSDECDQ